MVTSAIVFKDDNDEAAVQRGLGWVNHHPVVDTIMCCFSDSGGLVGWLPAVLVLHKGTPQILQAQLVNER